MHVVCDNINFVVSVPMYRSSVTLQFLVNNWPSSCFIMTVSSWIIQLNTFIITMWWIIYHLIMAVPVFYVLSCIIMINGLSSMYSPAAPRLKNVLKTRNLIKLLLHRVHLGLDKDLWWNSSKTCTKGIICPMRGHQTIHNIMGHAVIRKLWHLHIIF